MRGWQAPPPKKSRYSFSTLYLQDQPSKPSCPEQRSWVNVSKGLERPSLPPPSRCNRMGECCCFLRARYQCAHSLPPPRWRYPLERRRLGEIPRRGVPDDPFTAPPRNPSTAPEPSTDTVGKKSKDGSCHPRVPTNQLVPLCSSARVGQP